MDETLFHVREIWKYYVLCFDGWTEDVSLMKSRYIMCMLKEQQQ